MESSNVVINDELCSEIHSENTPPVPKKTKEVNDSIPDDYVGKHSDKEQQLLNNFFFFFFWYYQVQNHPLLFVKLNKNKVSIVPHLNKKVPLLLWSKVHLLE